jgi:hypothetical protein
MLSKVFVDISSEFKIIAYSIWCLLTIVQNLKLPPIQNGGFTMAA